MAFKYGKYDEILLGAIAGILLTVPKVSAWFADWIGKTLPVGAQFLGSMSIPFYGAIIGAIIGLIVGKTK